MPGTPADGTSRQSWERRRSERRSCRGRVEQLWLRLWRHRSARGPQGEQREKASRVVGPRMERQGKDSASFRASRAVGVQRAKTREPLQEAAPGGRPGRLGDAVEAAAQVDPGRLRASRESSSSDASTRDRPGGGRQGLAVAHPGCSCHQEGKVTGPEQAPAREGCGAASDAVRQVLARRRNTVGTTPAGRCNERTDRSVQCCHCRGFHSLTRQVAGSGGLLRAASDAPAAAGCTKGADRAAPDVADAMCEDPYGYPLVPRGDADDCTRTALQRTAKGLYTQKPVNPAETT